MSWFLLYFERANPLSKHYNGFRDVGNFRLPQGFLAASEFKQVIYENKGYAAAYLADRRGHCAQDIFLKRFVDDRQALVAFVRERLKNDCIIGVFRIIAA